jgi:hypothetical protein
MKDIFHERTRCRLCDSSSLQTVVELQPIPVKTPNVGNGALNDGEHRLSRTLVPLELRLCDGCGHLQLGHVIDPAIQYGDFRYETSISKGLGDHFVTFAREFSARLTMNPGAFVIELGSNDGTLLAAFQDLGCKVLGVDPAPVPAEKAHQQGIETLVDFFSQELAERMTATYGKADLIISNNTFANIDDVRSFTRGIRSLMKNEGLFLFETQYGPDVLDGCLLDTIYHEHLSYFRISPLTRFFDDLDMTLIDVQHIPTKGGSIRCIAQLSTGLRSIEDSVGIFEKAEAESGWQRRERYRAFANRIDANRAELKRLIDGTVRSGGKVYGYGASVGTMTLLHFLGIAPHLQAIIDDNPLTEKVIGGDREIPVLGADVLRRECPEMIVVFAWRYIDQIARQNADYLAAGGVFVTPFPDVRIIRGSDAH